MTKRPGWEMYGDFIVQTKEGRVWGSDRPRLNIVPKSPSFKVVIFSRGTDFCHLEFRSHQEVT